jgi:alpha-glucosidase
MQKIILAKGNPELVMFGDSHTANGRWLTLLSRTKVITVGFSGFTSDQLKNMLMIKVLPLKPEFCFIQCGGNDIASRCFDEQILVANVREMVDSLQRHHIRPVVQSLFCRHNDPDYNQHVDSINGLLRQFTKESNIPFLDINSSLIDRNGLKKELTIDNIHLNEKGYAIWSDLIKKHLN